MEGLLSTGPTPSSLYQWTNNLSPFCSQCSPGHHPSEPGGEKPIFKLGHSGGRQQKVGKLLDFPRHFINSSLNGISRNLNLFGMFFSSPICTTFKQQCVWSLGNLQKNVCRVTCFNWFFSFLSPLNKQGQGNQCRTPWVISVSQSVSHIQDKSSHI